MYMKKFYLVLILFMLVGCGRDENLADINYKL